VGLCEVTVGGERWRAAPVLATLVPALVGLLAGCDPLGTPAPAGVSPSAGPSDRATPVTVTGQGFLPLAHADFNGSDDRVVTRFTVRLGSQLLDEVSYVDSRTLRARVPAGMAPGRYDLLVIDPRGRRGQLADAFEVTAPGPGDGGPDGADVGDLGPADADAGDDGTPGDGGADAADGADAPDGQSCPPENAQDSCNPARGRLVACYLFEGDGTDGSGNGNDLQLANVAFGPGVQGMALRVSAQSAASSVDSSSWGSISDTFTLELQVRPDRAPLGNEHQVLVDRSQQYALYWQADGSAVCTLGATQVKTGAGALGVGRWSHLACTLQGGLLRLYLDGAMVDESAAGAVAPSTGDFHVGENSLGGTEQLSGSVDRLRIWSRALSGAEICRSAAVR
jgi:hypothetical protein